MPKSISKAIPANPAKYEVRLSQITEANLLFQCVERRAELPEKCTHLHVLIIVPARKSLRIQTEERVGAFIAHLEEKYSGCYPYIDVIMGNGSAATVAVTKEFFRALKAPYPAEEHHFFLILHDECHWGANYHGEIGKILLPTLEASDPPKNLLTIQISATAWNQIVILEASDKASRDAAQTLKENVHPGRTTRDDKNGTAYFGRQQLVDHKRIIEDQSTDNASKKLCKLVIRDATLRERLLTDPCPERDVVLIVMRYCAALLRYYCENGHAQAGVWERLRSLAWFQASQCDHTLLAVRYLFQGGLVAVRLPSGILSTTLSRVVTRLLCALQYDDQVFSIHDAVSDTETGGGNSVAVTNSCYMRLAALQRSQTPAFVQYQDLKGLPCLLVVIEKVNTNDNYLFVYDFWFRLVWVIPSLIISNFSTYGHAIERILFHSRHFFKTSVALLAGQQKMPARNAHWCC